ncbi:NAD(P)-binding protein [Fusarium austroafricanum]|uniref:NAD(P)-binding protein n=1 Tax=Fusarium austroafricanum TaxID=2364996 RepID=A0A8H4NG00_9HYPO|nr:NAD(P)-binding protein [Fusarium austroafricanum]
MSFTSKVIAITGAASGIGLATAKLLASEGATLALADAQEKTLKAAQKEIAATDVEFSALWSMYETMLQLQRFGKVNGLVTSAGVLGRQFTKADIHEIEDNDWDFVFDVNVKGTLNCHRAFIPSLNSGASIVT